MCFVADSLQCAVIVEKFSIFHTLCLLLHPRWMEEILEESLPPPLELEQRLANGVYLCQIGMKLLPDDPNWKKVENGKREGKREEKRKSGRKNERGGEGERGRRKRDR